MHVVLLLVLGFGATVSKLKRCVVILPICTMLLVLYYTLLVSIIN